MRYTNSYDMQRKARRKKFRRRFFSIISYFWGGIYALGWIAGSLPIGVALTIVPILIGVGMLLEQGARNAAEEERRYAEFNPNIPLQVPPMGAVPYYGNSSAAYRRYVKNLRKYGYPQQSRTYAQQSQPTQQMQMPPTQYAQQTRPAQQTQPGQQTVTRTTVNVTPKAPPAPPRRALQENFEQYGSVLEQGHAFAKEIDKANDLIPDEEISRNLSIICRYVNDIFALASRDAATERQIRKFANIYLPQTLKLCNLYIDLQGKRVETKTVKDLKDQINKSIVNATYAFSNLNDSLMERASIDIEAEIDTFESILTIDGLLNRHELVMPERTKEKEKA